MIEKLLGYFAESHHTNLAAAIHEIEVEHAAWPPLLVCELFQLSLHRAATFDSPTPNVRTQTLDGNDMRGILVPGDRATVVIARWQCVVWLALNAYRLLGLPLAQHCCPSKWCQRVQQDSMFRKCKISSLIWRIETIPFRDLQLRKIQNPEQLPEAKLLLYITHQALR
jgi:hypothetical protein